MRLSDLSTRFAILTFAPVLLAAAACGSTGSPAKPESTPSTERPVVPAEGTTGDSGTGTTPNEVTVDAGADADAAPEVAPIDTPDIVPSSLGGTFADAGLDIANLPATLEGFENSHTRVLMGTFRTSLGVQCTHCHETRTLEDGGTGLNAQAPTANKNITSKMYTEFVAKLRFKDGAPLYCDSCHQGKAAPLDRSSRDGVAKWMHTNFVEKLVQADGSAVNCASCHGRPFQPTFLDGWADPIDE